MNLSSHTHATRWVSRAAPGLLGALLAASALLTPASAAGLAPEVPDRPGKPPASIQGPKLPYADVRVVAKGSSGDNSWVVYNFEVTNLGPDAAGVKLDKEMKHKMVGGSSEMSITTHATIALANGQSMPVTVSCALPHSFECTGATLRATVLGIDPNTGNNLASI